MPMTKVVNGKRFEMTAEEERTHTASHPLVPVEIPEPSDIEVLGEALKAKRLLTQADLSAARNRLKS